ncbi:CAP-Gly domain-containing linker protein 4-like, partial [Mantella aurantiaca]
NQDPQACFLDSAHPVTFSVAAAPMPTDCEFSFFDPSDASCQDILFDPATSVSQLFAILRQWVPQVQQSIDVIGNQILERGCDVNDRDGLTDMTLLHYTCKSGAQGIGDAETAAKFASRLIDIGADISLRSRWTNMNALHYAAYFDVPEMIHVLLTASKPKGNEIYSSAKRTQCKCDVGTLKFCGRTQFASGQWAGVEMDESEGKNDGSVGGVQYFMCPPRHGIFAPLSKIRRANERMRTFIRNSSVKTANSSKSPTKIDLSRVTSKINTGLTASRRGAAHSTQGEESKSAKKGAENTEPSNQSPEHPEFRPGDRVLVVGQRLGTVRFYGKTSFAPGFWCGIELDKPHGKNDGSISGVQYFTCPPKHGVFAPPSRVQRISGSLDSLSEIPASNLNHSFPGFKRSLSSTSSAQERRRHSSARKPALRRSWSSTSSASTSDGGVKLHTGSQVLLSSSSEMAVIRYIGPADFAPGVWLGLELRSAKGKNDGSVGEKRYFHCKPNHGVLVRPGRVTYRGINGSKLVDDTC